VDFLVIGADIVVGLASTIAVGHQLLVLEKHDFISKVVIFKVQARSMSVLMTNLKATGSCRMPPNLSKLLFQSLERELLKISLISQGSAFPALWLLMCTRLNFSRPPEMKAVKPQWISLSSLAGRYVAGNISLQIFYFFSLFQAATKPIFPAAIGEDLLKVILLSNAFCVVNGAKPLQAGGACKAEACIVSATNANKGKIAKVKGHIYHGGKKVIKVIEVGSSFLYRGHFVDCEAPSHSHQPILHQLCLSLPLSLKASGSALPLVDMWRMLVQRATQTMSLRKFFSLYYNNLVMSSSSSYNFDFMDMVLCGDEPAEKLCYTGMLTGNIVVSIETAKARRCSRTAEVAQPATIYVYAGQGLQEPGMGMLLCTLFGKVRMSIYLQFTASLLPKLPRTTKRRRRFISEELKVKPFTNATCTWHAALLTRVGFHS